MTNYQTPITDLTSNLAGNTFANISETQPSMDRVPTVPVGTTPSATGGKKKKRSKKGKKNGNVKEDSTPGVSVKEDNPAPEPYKRAYIDKEPIPKDSVNPATYIKTPVDSQPRIPISSRSAKAQATMMPKPKALNGINVALPRVLLGTVSKTGSSLPTTELSIAAASSGSALSSKHDTSRQPSPVASFGKNKVIKDIHTATPNSSMQKPLVSTVLVKQALIQDDAHDATLNKTVSPIVAPINESFTLMSSAKTGATTGATTNPILTEQLPSNILVVDASVSSESVNDKVHKNDASSEERESSEYEYESESTEVEIIVDRSQQRKALASLPTKKVVAKKEEPPFSKKLANVFKAEADLDELHDREEEKGMSPNFEPTKEQGDLRGGEYEEYDGDCEEGNWSYGDYDADYDEDDYDEGSYEKEDHDEQISPPTSAIEKVIGKDQQSQRSNKDASMDEPINQVVMESLKAVVAVSEHATMTAAAQPKSTGTKFNEVKVKKMDEGELWYDPDIPANVGVNHVSSDEEYSGGVLRQRKTTKFKTIANNKMVPSTPASKTSVPKTSTPKTPNSTAKAQQPASSHKKNKRSATVQKSGYALLGDDVEC